MSKEFERSWDLKKKVFLKKIVLLSFSQPVASSLKARTNATFEFGDRLAVARFRLVELELHSPVVVVLIIGFLSSSVPAEAAGLPMNGAMAASSHRIMLGPLVAAIDQGTSSTRFLVRPTEAAREELLPALAS